MVENKCRHCSFGSACYVNTLYEHHSDNVHPKCIPYFTISYSGCKHLLSIIITISPNNKLFTCKHSPHYTKFSGVYNWIFCNPRHVHCEKILSVSTAAKVPKMPPSRCIHNNPSALLSRLLYWKRHQYSSRMFRNKCSPYGNSYYTVSTLRCE